MTPSISGGNATFSPLRNLCVAGFPTGTFCVTMSGGPSRSRTANAAIKYESAQSGTTCLPRLSSTTFAAAALNLIQRTAQWRRSGTLQAGLGTRSLTSTFTASLRARCTDGLRSPGGAIFYPPDSDDGLKPEMFTHRIPSARISITSARRRKAADSGVIHRSHPFLFHASGGWFHPCRHRIRLGIEKHLVLIQEIDPEVRQAFRSFQTSGSSVKKTATS
jgi:hypothetical protein